MKLSLVWSLGVKLALYASVYIWPAYASFHAIETKHSLDDTQWLFYWLIFAVYTVIEGATWPLLRRIPLYQELKLIGFAWLSLPTTSGAKLLYMKARPYILRGMSVIDTKYAEIKGGEIRSDKKEAELAKLRAEIADVQDDLTGRLSTAYESVKANTMDGADLEREIKRLRSEISAVVPPNSPVMSAKRSSDSLPSVDAKVTATVVNPNPASALAMSS